MNNVQGTMCSTVCCGKDFIKIIYKFKLKKMLMSRVDFYDYEFFLEWLDFWETEVDARSAVGWQAIAFNGLLSPE